MAPPEACERDRISWDHLKICEKIIKNKIADSNHIEKIDFCSWCGAFLNIFFCQKMIKVASTA